MIRKYPFKSAKRRAYHGDDQTEQPSQQGGEQTPEQPPADQQPEKPKKERRPRAKKEVEPPSQPDHFEDIHAPHTFTADEMAALNVELLTVLTTSESLADQAKSAAQDFKLRITNEVNKSKILRNKLTSGQETRQMRARVEFDSKRGMKRFHNPETGSFIREEAMQPADWQLPMFKPAQDGSEVVAPPNSSDVPKKGANTNAQAPASSPVGETSVGNALDKAAAETNTPPILITDFDKQDWTAPGFITAFKSAAMTAGWNEAQISVMKDRLKEADDVDKMKETVKPFLVAAAAQ